MIACVHVLLRFSQLLGSGGAGGNWPATNEHDDPRAIAQLTPLHCGCACALIAFQILRVPDLPTQNDISERGGGVPFSVQTLSIAMNEVWTNRGRSGAWLGQGIAPPLHHDYVSLVGVLGAFTPWIAHLREHYARIGHFVVVARLDGDHLEILDPAR